MRYDRLIPDDRLREVPRTWVGSGGYVFWWEARFDAYKVFAAVFPVLEFVGWIFWPWSLFPMVLLAALSAWITQRFMKFVDYERPLRAVLRHFVVGIPRAFAYRFGLLGRPAKVTTTVLTVRVNARRTIRPHKPLLARLALPTTHNEGAPSAQP